MIPLWLIVGLLVLAAFCIAVPLHIAMTGFCFLALAVVLLILRQFQKKGYRGFWKKLLIGLTVFAAAVILGCTGLVIAEGTDDVPEKAPDLVIVLGAQIHGENPSRTLRERLDLAKAYLEENPEAVCIVSGGQGNDEIVPESQVMESWLVRKGISEERILQENQSHNTRQNLMLSKEAAADHGLDPDSVCIITSEFHLFRAKYLAGKLGMTAYGLGSRTTPGILMVNYALREVFSMVKAMWQTA